MSRSDPARVLENWASAQLARLAPAARRRLARKLALEVRRDQQKRIAAQHNPDGSAYIPRKPRAVARSGQIRRKALFSKLRHARYLRIRTTANMAEIGFKGRAARIARIHHYGLHDRVAKNGPRIRYPRRELLGFTPELRAKIHNLLIEHLAG